MPNSDRINKNSNQSSEDLLFDIIKKADLIVKGKVMNRGSDSVKTLSVQTEDESNIDITMNYAMYDIKITESLKNPEKVTDIRLALFPPEIKVSSVVMPKVDIGTEYVFFLKNDNDSKDYLTINYENGIYELDKKSKDMKSISDFNVINYDLLNKSIKKLEKN